MFRLFLIPNLKLFRKTLRFAGLSLPQSPLRIMSRILSYAVLCALMYAILCTLLYTISPPLRAQQPSLSGRLALSRFTFSDTPLLLPSLLVNKADSLKTSRSEFQTGIWAGMGFIAENKRMGASASWAKGRNAVGLEYSYSGFSEYNTHKTGLSYAHSFFKELSTGISFAYIQHPKIENRTAFVDIEIALSLLYRLKSWDLGFRSSYLLPIISSDKKLWNNSLMLQIFANCRLSKELSIGLDISKDMRYQVEASANISYLIKSCFLVSGGCGVYPFNCFLGAGYSNKGFSLYVSTAYHPPLGCTGFISFGYKWF